MLYLIFVTMPIISGRPATATWHKAMPPAVPLYWRAAPGAFVGGLLVGGLVHDQHHVAAVLVLACGKMTGISRSWTQAPDSRCCIRCGPGCPAASPIVQQL